jgi:hypothetical protein
MDCVPAKSTSRPPTTPIFDERRYGLVSEITPAWAEEFVGAPL